ncbi:hypothetical protein BH20VER1_BH20VER1_19910 [soil metagenome]
MPPASPPVTKSAAAAALLARYAQVPPVLGSSYATVRDFCDSVDHLPQIAPLDGDLKNVQRPWAAKNVLGAAPPPARLLEIGGGEPIVSGFLADLGYDVTIVDPYDGAGNGPLEFDAYRQRFPKVKLVRDYLSSGIRSLPHQQFDIVFSISVLEHIPAEPLASCFAAIQEHLAPNGWSIHCFDFIAAGAGAEYDIHQAERILIHQAQLSATAPGPSIAELIAAFRSDLETFYLSPQGHHWWRGGQPYDAFPFRQVVSLQTVARRPAG